MAVISLPGQKQRKVRVFAAACSGLLALAVAAGIVAWQRAEHTPGTAADLGAGTMGSAPAAARNGAGQAEVAVYLVATQADAEIARELVAATSGLRAQLGSGSRSDVVVVVSTAEEEADLLHSVTAFDNNRGERGLPPVAVVDLRQPRVSEAALDPVALSDQEMYPRWLQAPVTTEGGLAELYREQELARRTSAQ